MPNSTDNDNRPTTLVDASDFDPVSLPRSFVRFSAKGLSAEARWMYVVLRANVSAGRQEHTVAEWAADAGFSTSTTRRALHELRDWGVISIAEQPVTATQYRPNEYTINPESHWRIAPVKESNRRKPGLPKKSGLPESAGLTNLVGKNLNTIPNTGENPYLTTFDKEFSPCRDPKLSTPILGTRPVDQSPKDSVAQGKTSAALPTSEPQSTPAQQTLNIALQSLAEKAPRQKKLATGAPKEMPTFAAKDRVTYRGDPALVLRRNKSSVIIVCKNGATLIDKSVSPNTLSRRENEMPDDPALLKHLETREAEYKQTVRRGELMDAWAKAANGAYGITGLNIAPLMRPKGGVFSLLAHLKLTAESVRCAGELFRAWWEVQKPLVSQDVGATVNAIKQAVNLCGRGFKPDHVKRAMDILTRQPFWQGKAVSFDTLVAQIAALVPMNGDGTPQKPHNPADFVFHNGCYRGERDELMKLGYIGPDGKYCGPEEYNR